VPQLKIIYQING